MAERRSAVGAPRAAAIKPAEEAPPAAEWRPRGTRENAPERLCLGHHPRRHRRLHGSGRQRAARRREAEVASRSARNPRRRRGPRRGSPETQAGLPPKMSSTVEARPWAPEPRDQGQRGSASTARAQAGPRSETGSMAEVRPRAPEPGDQGRHGSASTASAQASPPPETGPTVAPQSPPPKRRRADSGPKPQGPEFKIPESRWQYCGPKSA